MKKLLVIAVVLLLVIVLLTTNTVPESVNSWAPAGNRGAEFIRKSPLPSPKSVVTLVITPATKHLSSPLLLPWGDISESTNHLNSANLISNDNHLLAKVKFAASSLYRANVQTFTSSILLSESGSRFICPEKLPYAVDYQLINPIAHSTTGVIESPTIVAQGYTNACFNYKKDLLFGSDQHPSSSEDAKTMTAFIPRRFPEGCRQGISASQAIIFHINAMTTESPIFQLVNNQMHIVGYSQQTIVSSVDCNKICNTMLDYYCNADSLMYCKEVVLNSYYITGNYKYRNLPEYFCACKIYDVSWNNPNWAFPNAVDVESAVKYNNPLKSVTCSSMPPN